MSLRWRITLTAWGFRLGGSGVGLIAGAATQQAWLGLAALAWFFGCGPLLRFVILPVLFPETTCPGCKRVLPLVGRWRCGDHFTDHTDRHILTFYCTHGHRLEAFDCPRCRATITVQKGDPKRYRHGSAVRLRTATFVSPPGAQGLLVGHDERRRPVVIPPDVFRWHVAVCGGTGRGKSTLFGHFARQLLERGAGCTVLDPGGDLARTVLRHIPRERERDVLYLDVSDREHPFPMNILSAHDAAEAALLTEELLGVFHKLHAGSWGPLLSHQLRMSLRAVMTVGGTLRDVYGMFADRRARGRIVDALPEGDLRAFWTGEFPSIPALRWTAVTNKLAPIVFHPVLGPILAARACVLDADRLIAERGILIANLASGSPNDEGTMILGSFITQKIMAAAFRQRGLPEGRRVPHTVLTDEFQRFMHRAAGFDQLLAEARKFKLSLVVANQFIEQLSDGVRAALFGNVGAVIAFRVGHRDARVLTPEFAGALPADLMELGLGECLVRIGTEWTAVRTLPPAARPADDPTRRIIRTATEHRMTPRASQETAPSPVAEPENDTEFVQ
jgi:uncharacterized protein DUF87